MKIQWQASDDESKDCCLLCFADAQFSLALYSAHVPGAGEPNPKPVEAGAGDAAGAPKPKEDVAAGAAAGAGEPNEKPPAAGAAGAAAGAPKLNDIPLKKLSREFKEREEKAAGCDEKRKIRSAAKC
jgi:hypothetical protein